MVLVHGLFMAGQEFVLLARRLTDQGYTVRPFRYPSTRLTPRANAGDLARQLAGMSGDGVCFVAHSLGGLVLRHLADLQELPETTRAVSLGTPHAGSAVARELSRRAWARRLLGRSLEGGLLGDVPAWPVHLAHGVIAGSVGFGLGRCFTGLQRPNDGTVAVAETHLSGQHQHRIVATSHTGLLFSAEAARCTAHFLAHGRFP